MNHLSRSFPRFPASLSCFRPASVIPATIPSRYHRTVPQRRYSTCTPNPFNGNMSDQPPRHEMVYLPGVISPNRAFGVFRRVLHTGLYSQFVAMEVPVNGEIGDEVHTVDQVLFFTHGTGRAIVAGKEQDVKQGDVVIVPAGTQHQFLNTGQIPLEVVTVYSPAEHAVDTVHKTKEDGDAEEEAGEDEAPAWSQRPKGLNEGLGFVQVPK